MRQISFAAAGVVLFALPFLSVGVGAGHHGAAEPHADHAPRHGGILLMIGDNHLEVVEREQTIEVYPSDARREPIMPASGRVSFDEARPRALEWRGDRLAAPIAKEWDSADVEVTFSDGQRLAIRVPRQPQRSS